MKIKLIYLPLIFLIFYSCQSNVEKAKNIKPSTKNSIKPKSKENNDLKNEIEEYKTEKPNTKPPITDVKLLIDDETKYSKNFISKLRTIDNLKKVQLKEKMMIWNEKDTFEFPIFPEINKHFTLTGRKDELSITLNFKRINYTSINYNLEIVEFEKFSKTVKGIADLGNFFFLASEIDTDELTNYSYPSIAFSNEENDCYTYIRIGDLSEPNKPLLGKIIKNCNGKITDIDLNNFPTLREK